MLGPEMRSTGEVMATASDLPTAFAKAERAAGRPLPTSGVAFLSVRDVDKPSIAPIAAALAGLGFELVATNGTARTLRAAGLDVEEVGKVSDADPGEPTVVDLIRDHRCNVVVNTPQGSGARADGSLIREAALVGPRAVHHDDRGGSSRRARDRERPRGGNPVAAGAYCRNRLRPNRLGNAERAPPRGRERGPSARTGSSGSGAPGFGPERRGSSSCSRRPGGCCRALQPLRCPNPRAGVPRRPDRARDACDRRPRAGDAIRVTGPLGKGFDLAVSSRCSWAAGSGSPRFRTSRNGSVDRPPCWGSARPTMPRRPRSSRTPRSCSTRRSSPTPCPPSRATCSPAARSRCSTRSKSAWRAQLAREAPMACGYGACYGCVVERDGGYARLCVEGPVVRGGTAGFPTSHSPAPQHPEAAAAPAGQAPAPPMVAHASEEGQAPSPLSSVEDGTS